MQTMDAPTSPTTSTSATSSPATSSAGGAGPAGGATSSDTASAGGANSEHTPPRRRLVKSASRHFDEQPPRVIAKREGGGIGTGPPGFAFERSGSPSPTSPGIAGSPGSTSLGVSSASPGIGGTFRDRERAGIRSSVKGDSQVDYSMNSPHGPAGSSGPNKLGRTPFAANPGVTDARPLGRRPEVNLRRHEAPNAQKHAEDMRIQQAKRASLVRAQTMNAPGNYRSFDSQYGNYLVPVIPNQFFNKNPTTSQASPALPSQVNQGR